MPSASTKVRPFAVISKQIDSFLRLWPKGYVMRGHFDNTACLHIIIAHTTTSVCVPLLEAAVVACAIKLKAIYVLYQNLKPSVSMTL